MPAGNGPSPVDPSGAGPERGGAHFASTHWSLVLAAGQSDSPQAIEALETLCRTYWYPVYSYVRRKGRDVHEAQDLTQEFFCRVIERHFLRAADRKRGKFRSFLLASLEHFLAKEWNRAHRKKRGGGLTIVSLEDGTGESRYHIQASETLAPEKLFEREWALAVVEEGMTKLRAEYTGSGRGEIFELLKPLLSSDCGGQPYPELAARLHLTEGALRVAVHRLRQRYGECLREVIAQTVSRADEVEEEIAHLLSALS